MTKRCSFLNAQVKWTLFEIMCLFVIFWSFTVDVMMNAIGKSPAC